MSKDLKRLFSILHTWKPMYGLAGVMLILSSLIRMLEPKILQIAVDGVVVFFQKGGQQVEKVPDPIAAFFYNLLPEIRMDNLKEILLWLCVMLVVISLLRVAAQFFASIITASSTEKAIKRLRDILFYHIQLLPMSHLNKTPTADLIQRCTGDLDTIRKFIGTQVVEFIRLIAIFIGAIAIMWSVHATYTLWAVALVPFIFGTAYYFFKMERKVWEEHEKEQDKLTAIIQENLNGIRVVQAFAKEDYEIERFKKQNILKREVGLKHTYLHQNFWAFSDLLVNIQILIALCAGAYYTINGAITTGEFASLFTYSIVITWPMRQLGRVVSQMGMAEVAMQRVGTILDATEEDYAGLIPTTPFRGEIEFKNVSFKYTEADKRWALEQVSFKVAVGEKIALLGSTGSGKSSIIALLGRFYEPTAGEIFLDGYPLNKLDKHYVRSSLGIVHQKPFLFSTTIKDNIAFTKKDASETEIKEAARAAAVADFISILSKGYDTLVGEKGVTLSGGQKQRVALARTLLSDPNILVLDDSTSAVDTETEYAIQQALLGKMKDKTTFIIAHRLTSVQHTDKIIVLEKGQIVEMGTHDTLLLNNGFYKKVFDIQVSLEEEIQAEIKR